MGGLLSPKFYQYPGNPHSMWYWCLGCQMLHPVHVSRPQGAGPSAVWDWNKDLLKPTFSPSLRHHLGPKKMCHVFIRDGNIQYLSDCTHDYKDQTVPLPDIPLDEID